jgi:hypothetical protein
MSAGRRESVISRKKNPIPTHTTALCAHCGRPVQDDHGFFRISPDPIALHHDCIRPYSATGKLMTGGKPGRAEVRWS